MPKPGKPAGELTLPLVLAPAAEVRPRYHLPVRGKGGVPMLSWSQVDEYLKCPACYQARRVLKVPGPRMHISLPQGTGIHGGVAFAREQKREHGTVKLRDIVEAAVGRFRADFSRRHEVEWDFGKYGDVNAVEEAVVGITRAAAKGIVARELEDGAEYVDIETDVEFDGVFPFKFVGKQDARVRGPLGTRIKDLKTSKSIKAPDAYYAAQLALYGLPALRAGEQPDALIIDMVSKTPDKNTGDYPVDVFIARPSPEEYQAAYNLVLAVANAISAGDFPARPGWWCKYRHGFASFTRRDD